MQTLLLSVLFFITAALYAAVGLGGGSGYLAMMGLVGVSPDIIRPTALSLNILVAGIGTWRHVRSGHFDRRIFWPIALFSIPFAFVGGMFTIPAVVYRPIVAAFLTYAAYRLWVSNRNKNEENQQTRSLPIWIGSLAGAIIGAVSGLIGIGGGVFLSAIILIAGWTTTRKGMGITAAFVLVNSIAGLMGNLSVMQSVPHQLPYWLLAAGLGGWLGTSLSTKGLEPKQLRKLLAFVCLIAAVRMLLP
ncbi:MAG: sulfite exporter TauE/SafE family protein [Chloroflexota bacterium]